jgi:APA family basic amino acid/polyamine antiporter
LTPPSSALARRLGLTDVALIVIGGVIGSGIFRAPAVVAQRLPAPAPILAAWLIGGGVAIFGAFVLGELGARRPDGCGAYAYLREAFHPVVGFAFGWTSLLASLSGGIAAAAVLFAGYFLALTGWSIAPVVVAVVALAALAIVNALGVREGSNVQSAFAVLKIGALVAIVAAAFVAHPASHPVIAPAGGFALGTLGAFSVAMIPVLFTYNGAMVANFIATEVRSAARALPLGLWVGMVAIVLLYLAVNLSYLRTLGVDGLARSAVPASAVFLTAFGSIGSRLASLAIAITTLGFISNRMLTVPRLYHAMAEDGLFFRQVAWIDPRTRVPVVAIVLQGVFAILIALSGGYDQILNYVVATIYIFNGLLALALFVLRARDRASGVTNAGFRVPWHPFSTAVYLVASWGVAIATCIAYPRDVIVGLAIMLSSVPVYFLWVRRTAAPNAAN